MNIHNLERQKEKCPYVHYESGGVYHRKGEKNSYLLQGFTILDTYIEYTSFPIKVR